MKKYIFLLIMLVCSVTLQAQTPRQPERSVEVVDDGVIVTYTFTDKHIFSSQYYPNSSYWSYQGFGINDTPGEPGVPFRNDSFVVPLESDVSVEVIDSAFTDTTFILSPAMPMIPMNGAAVNLHEIESYDGFFPHSIAEHDRVTNFRDVGVVNVCLSPIQYDNVHHIVRAYSYIKYKVSYNSDPVYSSSSFLDKATLNNSRLKNKAQRGMKSGNEPEATQDDRGLLIITTNEYKPALQSFVKWKRTKGFRVFVETKAKGTWTIDSVKNKITAYYTNTQDRHIDNVLIVGNVDDVPAKVDNFTFHIDKKDTVVYATNDYVYGLAPNYGDDNEGLAQVHRGRIPVDNISELRRILSKIIQYEKTPVMDSTFYQRGVNCAYFESYKIVGNNFTGYEKMCDVMNSENIRIHLQNNYNKSVEGLYSKDMYCTPTNWNSDYYSYGGVIPQDSINWYCQASDIVNSINNGAFYVLYGGHGTPGSWHSMGFTTQHIDSLTNNNKLPVVFGLTCDAGAYNLSGDCMTERFLKKRYGGCVGIYGNSAMTFGGYTETIYMGMFDAIFPGLTPVYPFKNYNSFTPTVSPTYALGEVLDLGLKRMSETFGRGDMYGRKYSNRVTHLFGDPTMEIWTDTPQKIDNPLVVRTKDSIFVQVNDGFARITIYLPALEEEHPDQCVYSYVGTELSHYIGDENIIDVEDIIVCIDRHNCIPYVLNGADIYYLQNDTISGNRTITGNRIIAGRNVTDKQAPGKVLFDGGGTVNIKGKQRVELHPGTEIKVGTKVIINKREEEEEE